VGAADRGALTLRQAPKGFLLVDGQSVTAPPVDAVVGEPDRVVVVPGDALLDPRRAPLKVQQVAQAVRRSLDFQGH
jgi:hypothetical protein